jgi:1-acyl-sn-glycerol-3-phosphate acyltransferase
LKSILLALIYKFLLPLPLKLLGVKIYGQQNLKIQGQFIIVANHNSHLDTMALMSSLPLHLLIKTHPVATAQYFGRKKWLVWLSNLFVNTVLIQRKEDAQIDPEAAQHIDSSKALTLLEDKLANGHSLIIFPEGTRGEPEKLQNFRKGIGVLLQRFPNIHYIPVFINGTGKILPKGALLPVPFEASLRIGKPQLIETDNVEDIVEEVKNVILDIQIKNRTA